MYNAARRRQHSTTRLLCTANEPWFAWVFSMGLSLTLAHFYAIAFRGGV